VTYVTTGPVPDGLGICEKNIPKPSALKGRDKSITMPIESVL
jgi:hypothetical protein